MRRSQRLVGRIIRPQLSRAAKNSDPLRDLTLAYVAGESVADAVDVAGELTSKGLALGFTSLALKDDLSLQANLAELLEQLPNPNGVEFSVRPLNIGIDGSPQAAGARLEALCVAATEHGAVVTLEMQGHKYYEETLALHSAIRAEHPTLGITIPAEFRRAERDVRELADEQARVRACVGGYPAPSRLALTNEHDKAMALVRCLKILFSSGAYPMVASHDPVIIEIAQELAHRNNRLPWEFEFQMMLGVRPMEQRRLVDIGLRCRTYIPFGPDWYEYFSDRIVARPRIVVNYLRSLLDKR